MGTRLWWGRNTLAVGAYRCDCAVGNACGAVYVFQFNGTSWVQEQKLTASDGAADDRFGHSVSLAGDTILAGADLVDCAAGDYCGAAYAFRCSPQEPEEPGSNPAVTKWGLVFLAILVLTAGTVMIGRRRPAMTL